MTLTFWGFVTSSVTWPFNLWWTILYGWSIPLWPCVYLAPLWRYGTSKIGRTHARMFRRFYILCPMLSIALDRQKVV